jgi:hypothetical protein
MTEGPTGTGTVIDGSNSTYAQMTLFQGPDSAKSGTPTTGSIYFALDTGKMYWAQSGSWTQLSEELVGDVTKPANSNVTALANVFASPGTYGSNLQTPILTIDAKGRVTNLSFEPISGTSSAGGVNTSLQFNDGGTLNGASIFFNTATNGLVFTNPAPTREALSPLTTKGDIFIRTNTSSARLPLGDNGQILRVDNSETTGLRWISPTEAEIRFNFGDATPKNLISVPANKVIQEVSITILVAFDDASSTLSVAPGLLDATDNRADVLGTYSAAPGIQFGVNTALTLSINPASSTQGSGLVTIRFEE